MSIISEAKTTLKEDFHYSGFEIVYLIWKEVSISTTAIDEVNSSMTL